MEDSTLYSMENIYMIEEQIENLYNSITYKGLDSRFFLREQPICLDGKNEEQQFREIISYLYKLYVERSSNNINTLGDFAHLTNIEKNDITKNLKTVHAFRTLFEHYLSESSHSKSIKNTCTTWYRSVLGKNIPNNNNDWKLCCMQIQKEALLSLGGVSNVLEYIIERNEPNIYSQWFMRQKQNIPKYEKISILKQIKELYNFPYNETNLYSEKQVLFNDKIRLLDFQDFNHPDIEKKIYSCFEEVVLSLDIFPCPITGKEVKKRYRVEGNKLQKIMKAVIEHYKKNPCLNTVELYDYIEQNFFLNENNQLN